MGRPTLRYRLCAKRTAAAITLLHLCVAVSTSAGQGLSSGGRKVLQDGGPCGGAFFIINNCASRGPIHVTVGEYRVPQNPAYSQKQPGWETVGWKPIPYGHAIKVDTATFPPNFIFSHTRSVAEADALPNSSVNPRAFCIPAGYNAKQRFRLTVAEPKQYYFYNTATKKTTKSGSCVAAKGTWVYTAVVPDCGVQDRPSDLPAVTTTNHNLPAKGRFMVLPTC